MQEVGEPEILAMILFLNVESAVINFSEAKVHLCLDSMLAVVVCLIGTKRLHSFIYHFASVTK